MEEELEQQIASSKRKKETCEETFYRLLPWYLSMGMTYHEYWDEAPELVKHYRDAYEYARKSRNEEMWREGYYIYIAVSTALSNGFRKKGASAIDYLEEPIPFTKLELKEKQEKEERSRLARIMNSVMTKVKKMKMPKGE